VNGERPERPKPTLTPVPPNFAKPKKRQPGTFLGESRQWLPIPGIGYRLDIQDLALSFDARKLRSKSDQVIGLLTVRVQMAGAKTISGNVVACSDFNFSSDRSRAEKAKQLETRCGGPEIDWRGLVEEVCVRVIEAQDRGEPELQLADVKLPEKEYETDLMAADFPLLRRQPTIWFGDGGCGKSMFAMWVAIALAESGTRVLYLDWELDATEHVQRLVRFIGPTALPSVRHTLFYRRCQRPIVDDTLSIKEIIARRNIQFLICDSLSFGARAPIEASESALTYQQAVREFGNIGSLHIAHVNRSEQGDQRPFGSTYWHNMARSTWYLKRGEEGGSEVTVGFFHRKANLSAQREPFAKKLIFNHDRTFVTPGDLGTDAAMVKQLQVPQRIELALQNRPMAISELFEECGGDKGDKNKISQAVHRGVKKGRLVKFTGRDGIDRIKLSSSDDMSS